MIDRPLARLMYLTEIARALLHLRTVVPRYRTPLDYLPCPHSACVPWPYLLTGPGSPNLSRKRASKHPRYRVLLIRDQRTFNSGYILWKAVDYLF
jgi:hypothetical protein